MLGKLILSQATLAIIEGTGPNYLTTLDILI